MGLLAFAIRLTLWRALYGATYAGPNVFDSAVGAIEMVGDADIERRPVLTVSTDEEKHTPNGNDWLTGDREIDLVVEMAIWTAIKDKAGVEIAHTDDGLEMALNYLGRQVMRIMQVDDGSEWGDLFRTFAGQIDKVEAKRGGSANKGERIAARQVIITLKPTFGEPAFGVAPVGEWARLIAAIAADDILKDIAPGLAAEIEGTAIPEWARLQAAIGLSRRTMVALGLGPLPPDGVTDPPEAPPVLNEATTQGDHIGSVVVPEEDP